MTSTTKSVLDYIEQLPEDRKQIILKLQEVILNNLPAEFKEEMSYGMIGYVVPHQLYPKGYHCNPKLPLPFLNIASQKNYIAIYHMGLYANSNLMDWFLKEYSKHSSLKLDIGKSCIRFKKIDQIPFQLIGELCTKMSAKEWIETYKNTFISKKNV